MDSGNLANEDAKLEFTASLLVDMGYDAIGVGETDIRLFGGDYYERVSKAGLTVLEPVPGVAKSASPYMLKEVGGVKVAVFSFNSHGMDGSEVPSQARKAVFLSYKAAREASDILVVLDQGGVVDKEWLERNGPRFGVPDVVIGGMKKMGMPKEEVIGRTRIMPTSMQGKMLGVVDIELEAGRETRFAAQMVPVDSNIADDKAIADKIQEFDLKRQKIATQPPPMVTHISADPNSPDKPYYSASACRTCHMKQYDDWKATRHAHAINTLSSQGRATPECLPCHSEQFRRVKTVTLPGDGIGGVECASCHMQALPHGAERRNVTAKTKVDPSTCLVCHTRDRSPKYEEKSYFAKVAHIGAEVAKTSSNGRVTPPSPPSPPGMLPR